MPKKALHQRDFTGGINTDSEPRAIGENQAVELKNLLVRKAGRLMTDYETAVDFTIPVGTAQATSEGIVFRSDYNENGVLGDTTFIVISAKFITTSVHSIYFLKKVGDTISELNVAPFQRIDMTGTYEPSFNYTNGVLTISDASLNRSPIRIYHVNTKRFGFDYVKWVKENSATYSGIISQDMNVVSSSEVYTSETHILGLVQGSVGFRVWYGGQPEMDTEACKVQVRSVANYDDFADYTHTHNGHTLALTLIVAGENRGTFNIIGTVAEFGAMTIKDLKDLVYDRYVTNAIAGAVKQPDLLRYMPPENYYGDQTEAEYKAQSLAYSGSAENEYYNINYFNAQSTTMVMIDAGADTTELLITDYATSQAYADIPTNGYVRYNIFTDNVIYPLPTSDTFVLITNPDYSVNELETFDSGAKEFAIAAEYYSGRIDTPVKLGRSLYVQTDSLMDLSVRVPESVNSFGPQIKNYNIYIRDAGTEEWYFLCGFDFDEGLKSHDGISGTITKRIVPDIISGTNNYIEYTIKGIGRARSSYSDFHLLIEGSEPVDMFKRCFTAGQRVYALAPKGYEDRIIISGVNKPSALYSENYLEIVKQDGDSFVCGMANDDKAYLFKNNKLYVLNIGSYEPSTFYIEHESPIMGVSSPNAVCKTGYGVFFANKYGVFFSQKGNPVNIVNQRIEKDWLENVNNPVLIYKPGKNLLYCLTDTLTPKVFIFDLLQQAWTTTDVFDGLTDHIAPVRSNSDDSFFIEGTELFTLTNTNRTATATIKTRDYAMSGASIRKKLKHFYATLKGITSANFTVNQFKDSGEAGVALANEATDKGEMIDYKVSVNFYSIMFEIIATMGPTAEIKDIGIIYREKLPK